MNFQKLKNIIKYQLHLEHRSFPLQRINGHRFCFIHINKNAGTSISKAVGLYHRMHFTVRDAIDNSSEQLYHSCFKFTVVRNPYTRIISMYNYAFKMNEAHIKRDNLSFEDWVLKTFKEKNEQYFFSKKILGTQTNYLINYHNKIDLDLIIKFEDLKGGYQILKEKLSLKEDLPNLNKTEKEPLSNKIKNDKILEIINNYFKEDFENFNYKKYEKCSDFHRNSHL